MRASEPLLEGGAATFAGVRRISLVMAGSLGSCMPDGAMAHGMTVSITASNCAKAVSSMCWRTSGKSVGYSVFSMKNHWMIRIMG